ncbi:hypothetical protein VHEMI09353 [[Torrubiella] hemipterigena]|uniref:DUF7907 domain-containing protein n=1 Tax=[Torrubiella] hemipterigena TaxID=1531966 RepID=A0A0A1TG63_9HYPO|nr:hypothetical protein VHEMI09353 [[Torrubiella] hemipterigena]
MKFIAAASLALAGIATAQNVQSKPFKLVLSSDDAKWNGKGVSACHVGAAIESLCIGDHSIDFTFNTTEGAQPAMDGYSPSGLITWSLPASPPIPEAMSFTYQPSSDLALPLFEPGYGTTYVSFRDSDGQLNIISYLDDTVSPAVYKTEALSQWYVCLNNYSGYQYNNLNWLMGKNTKPQNPSCSAVTVNRVWSE